MASPLADRSVVVTGGAGFIGGHLAEALASHNRVTVLDDLSTGRPSNVPAAARLVTGDARDEAVLRTTLGDADVVFHLAALPSVGRSVADPLRSHEVNATGTLMVLEAARRADVERFVYAASSSAYGDVPVLPKREDQAPMPRSPYAVAKLAGEGYVRAYASLHGLRALSLRYFNVYGPRQDPDSPYAAVVPRFLRAAIEGGAVTIYGDGLQTRDFTYVDDVVHANLLAAASAAGAGDVVNVSGGRRVSILDLARLAEAVTGRPLDVQHAAPRPGDVRDSEADLTRARQLLGYTPRVGLREGLDRTYRHLVSSYAPPRPA